MSLTHFARLVIGTAFVFALSTAAQALPPAEAFGSLPAMDNPKLSPDGKHFAVIQAVKGKPVAAIYQVGAPAGALPALVAASDGLIEYIEWANNDRLLIFLKLDRSNRFDGTMVTWRRVMSVNSLGKDAVMLLNSNNTLGNNLGGSYVADLTPEDPDHVLMGLFGFDRNHRIVLNLYKVDVNTGKSEIAQYGTPDTVDWVTDGHGRVVAMVDDYRGELRQRIKLPDGEGWREIVSFDRSAGGEGSVAGLIEDGTALAVVTRTSASTESLLRVDLAKPAMGPTLFSNPSYDISEVLTDQWTGRVIGVAYADQKMQYVYFDPERQKLQRSLEAAFPGRTVRAVSSDLAHKTYIVGTDAPREPQSYYYYDAAAHHAYAIGTAYPMLAESDLGEMRHFTYAARDGLRISAYLTLPPGAASKGLPLVVMPHGGPEVRDVEGFDWWAQFLANRGYAVFQPNFRGSGGYGQAMVKAGLQQWGKGMQDDITDGVKQLIADGTADSKRICIVGASYGGYAALAGATFTPDLYRCAISVAPISDLDAMLDDVRRNAGKMSFSLSYWESRIGKQGSPGLSTVSPARHVEQIHVPVLLMHAVNDATVPINQSERMRDAMQRASKPVEFIALEGDDHYLGLAATRIRVLKECERFLAVHIGSQAQATTQ